MKENIVGREAEIEKLESYISSRRSEFIAIYGRRRVGKTFLVKELFENRFAFRITGKDHVTTKEQLASFCFALSDQFGIEPDAANWPEAFRFLQKALEKKPEGTKIIFFDAASLVRHPCVQLRQRPGTFLERLGFLSQRHQADRLRQCHYLDAQSGDQFARRTPQPHHAQHPALPVQAP